MTSTRLCCPYPSPQNPPRSAPGWPNTSPITISCELSTVSLKVAEGSPLNHKVRETVIPVRSSARFGAPSNNPFFCRNNPHSQRVHHIKGIDERPICALNDVIFGQMPQYCLGRVMTPEKSLVLQCKIPISAIGTNTTYLPTDVITGLQFFPLKMIDSSSLRLLTEAWCAELQELTEKIGLLGPTGKGSTMPSSPRPSSGAGLAGSRDRERTLKMQLMVIDMLSQILQMESIGEIQQWMLNAGHREKDQVLLLLRASLAQESVSAGEIPDIEELTMIQVENQCLDSRLASISEQDATRDQSSKMMSDSSKMEYAESEGSKPRTSRERRRAGAPRTTFRALGSPSVCHLNQKVVLRYTKRFLLPQTTSKGFQGMA
ncbi:uncharacterized protein LOC134033993 [Osmerus eperlanus]|uniref:uncharacterized protein LOC134033993 n=1 Tax=Osmerus eperlanus TaxID=29151 RepID=UPI002E1489E9